MIRFFKADFKYHIQEIQILQTRCDLTGKLFCTLASLLMKFFTICIQFCLFHLQSLLQLFPVSFIVLQSLQFFLLFFLILQHFFYRGTILRFEMIQHIQPFIHLVKLFIRKCQLIHTVCHFMADIRKEAFHIRKHTADLQESIFTILNSWHFLNGTPYQFPGSPFIVGITADRSQAFQYFLTVQSCPIAFLQFFIFSHSQMGFLNLIYFEFQKWHFPFSGFLIHLIGFQFFFQSIPFSVAFFHILAEGVNFFFSVSIQNLQLMILIQQRLVFMLSVNIDQNRWYCFKCRHLYCLAIDLADTSSFHQSSLQCNKPIFRVNIQFF